MVFASQASRVSGPPLARVFSGMGILDETFAALAARKRDGLARQLDAALREVTTPEEQQAVVELLLGLSLLRVHPARFDGKAASR